MEKTTTINIAARGTPLARVSFEKLSKVTVETNLSPASTAQAIAEAMTSLARPMGGATLDQAKAEAAEALAKDKSPETIAKCLARMVSELFANFLGVPFDVDLDDWRPPNEN